MAKLKEITLREKVAIKSLIFGIIPNWTDAFKIAYDGTQKEIDKMSSLQTIVSRWKNSHKIQSFYTDSLYLYNHQREMEKQAILESVKGDDGENQDKGDNVHTTKREESKPPKLVDFSNPQNQMQKLNELVNSSEDVGETLDALKVIISTQKADRESAREGKQVKSYLPITCNECPLYQKGRKKVTI